MVITGVIYKYKSPSNKIYIGQTIHPHTRFLRHKRMEGDSPFHRAIKKYGFENFSYEEIVTISSDDRKLLKERLDWFERYYIKKYKSYEDGYNLTIGGEGGSGIKHTDEFKQNTSERMKTDNPAWNMTDEWRIHISESQIGKKMSDEFCEKTSERMKRNNPMKNPLVAAKVAKYRTGIHLSEEHKKKISETLKGRTFSEETKVKISNSSKLRLRDSKGHFIKNNL